MCVNAGGKELGRKETLNIQVREGTPLQNTHVVKDQMEWNMGQGVGGSPEREGSLLP